MTRKDAREKVMQILFQIDAQADWESMNFKKYFEGINFADQEAYATKLLTKICENKESVDALINENSKGWPVTRIAKTDLAVLRLAVGEILYMDNVPNAVAINEAVNMAKIYGEEHSPKFLNAVLGKIQQAAGKGM